MLFNYSCMPFKKSKINNLPRQKALGSDGFIGEYCQTFKKEVLPIVYNLFQEIEAEGTLPNLSYEANILLKPKPGKDITRKLQTNTSHEHGWKNLPQNINKSNLTMYKKNYRQ